MNSGRGEGLPITPGLMAPVAQAVKASDQAIRPTHTFSFSAMATIYELHLDHGERPYASQAAAACFSRLDEIERELSRFLPGSDISGIAGLMQGETVVLGQHTFACLATAQKLAQATGGAFDIAYLSRAEPADTEPTQRKRLPFILDDHSMTFRSELDHLKLDLGGIGKGYALDSMAEILREWELDRALLQGGRSSVLAVASPDGGDGWELTISRPDEKAELLARVTLQNQAMGASGLLKGPHIKHPDDVDSGEPGSVSAAWALGGSAAEIDAMSTAAMVLPGKSLAACCQRMECSIARLEAGPTDANPGEPDRLSLYGERQHLFVPV